MKYFYLLIVICFISCGKEKPETDNRNCIEVEYETDISLHLADELCFPDGNSFEVKVISDEFCCCLCYCAWEGELEIMVETTDPEGNKDLLSFGSSTYNLKNDIFDGYIVSKIEYLYNNEPNSLPLCEGEYDPSQVELTFEISPK